MCYLFWIHQSCANQRITGLIVDFRTRVNNCNFANGNSARKVLTNGISACSAASDNELELAGRL
jgi:hypothetical protein